MPPINKPSKIEHLLIELKKIHHNVAVREDDNFFYVNFYSGLGEESFSKNKWTIEDIIKEYK